MTPSLGDEFRICPPLVDTEGDLSATLIGFSTGVVAGRSVKSFGLGNSVGGDRPLPVIKLRFFFFLLGRAWHSIFGTTNAWKDRESVEIYSWP